MPEIYAIDTSAWIEYLNGSEKAVKFREIIEKETLVTSIITIAELSDKFQRDGKEFENTFNFINSRSKIAEIGTAAAIEAGRLKNKTRQKRGKFSLADAIIYVLSKSHGATLITTDKDFEGLEKVIIF